MNNKVNILGVGISNLNTSGLNNHLLMRIETGKKTQVCFTPTNSILYAYRDLHLKKIYNEAEVVMCDGVPVQWASKFLGTPLQQRITGFDYFPQFVAFAATRGLSVFFMGAADGVAEKLAYKFQLLYPQLKVAGWYTPPFASRFNDEQNSKIIDAINRTTPDILFVSLTAPKQDIWIYEHLDNLNVKVALGVGAAFDTEAGSLQRAPYWIRNSGFEWLYRFSREPKRLFRRYFIEAPQFIPLVIAQKMKWIDVGE